MCKFSRKLLFVSHETNPCGQRYDVYLDPVSDLRYRRYFDFESILNRFWIGFGIQNEAKMTSKIDFESVLGKK